jgi:outer membrane immunogenic protein
MKHVFLSTAALALLSGGALAADLPAYEPPPVAVATSVYDWTGFYVGVSGGWAWLGDDDDADIDCTDFGPACINFPATVDLNDGDGGLIGGTAGFNFQVNQFVFGIEGDLSWANWDQDGSFTFPGGGGFTPFTLTVDRDIDWFGTLRGRVGFAFDRFLIFGTGGLAAAGVDTTTTAVFTPTTTGDFAGSSDDTEFGWTLGGGGEVAVTQHITIKAEALYFNLGDQSVIATDPQFPGFSYTVNTEDLDGVIGRVGANFKF